MNVSVNLKPAVLDKKNRREGGEAEFNPHKYNINSIKG